MARPTADAALLNPELIIATALRLIDEQGVEALSMRRLATELGVTPRSLYYYVPTKDELLRQIYLHVMNKLRLPEGDNGDWRTILRGLAQEFRALCHNHRSVMPYFLAGHEPCGCDTAIMDRVFGILRAAGIQDPRVIVVSQTLVAFLAGYILAELNGMFARENYSQRKRIARDDPEQFPMLHQLPAPPTKASDNFGLALELMISAIEGQLPASVSGGAS